MSTLNCLSGINMSPHKRVSNTWRPDRSSAVLIMPGITIRLDVERSRSNGFCAGPQGNSGAQTSADIPGAAEFQSPLAKNLVLFAQDNDFRPMRSNFRRIEQSEAHDRQNVPWFSETRGGSVEHDRSMTANPVNDVCLKSFAVHEVPDQDSLVLFEFNKLGKISRNA